MKKIEAGPLTIDPTEKVLHLTIPFCKVGVIGMHLSTSLFYTDDAEVADDLGLIRHVYLFHIGGVEFEDRDYRVIEVVILFALFTVAWITKEQHAPNRVRKESE